MDIQIEPGPLNGTIRAIASNSELHRMLICAAFADGATEIQAPGSAYDGEHPLPNDIRATMACLKALGASFELSSGSILVTPSGKSVTGPLLDCGESGSTLRFLLPVAAAAADRPSFTGSGRLPDRPIEGLTDALKLHGISMSADRLPFTLSGSLTGGVYEISGDISSQYLTGLLLTLPLLREKAEIRLTTPLRSAGYIDITTQVMAFFGAETEKTAQGYRLREQRTYRSPGVLMAGGDWSNTAAFLAASALREDSRIFCQCLYSGSMQGDREILSLLERFGAEIVSEGSAAAAYHGSLRGTEIDIDPTPDLLPVLAVTACAAQGRTVFCNAGRLRLKESDRIESTAAMIRALGGSVETETEKLIIQGSGTLRGGTVDAANDHRIVMAASIAAGICSGPVIIRGAEAVNKSYPTFFEDLKAVKGEVHVL